MVLFWALPALVKWLIWTTAMRKKAGVLHKLPSDPKPDCLVLVNSFLLTQLTMRFSLVDARLGIRRKKTFSVSFPGDIPMKVCQADDYAHG